MPCLWANDDALLRQHLHESDVPVQAVAEDGGNVVTVRELIEQLLRENMEENICIRVDGGSFWGFVAIDGISGHTKRVGTVLLEPEVSLVVEKDGKP